MECGDCTLCCKILTIKSMNSPAGKMCRACSKDGKSCTVHDKGLPTECSSFECSYYQVENIPITLRPDKCGTVFEKIDDKVFLGTQEIKESSGMAHKQINSFLKQGYSVVIAVNGIKSTTHLAKGATKLSINKSLIEMLRSREQWQHTEQI